VNPEYRLLDTAAKGRLKVAHESVKVADCSSLCSSHEQTDGQDVGKYDRGAIALLVLGWAAPTTC